MTDFQLTPEEARLAARQDEAKDDADYESMLRKMLEDPYIWALPNNPY